MTARNEQIGSHWTFNKIPITTVKDARGLLQSLDFSVIDFQVRRIYWIYMEKGSPRGFHAHKSLTQALIVLDGEVSISLEHGQARDIMKLTKSDLIVIRPKVWRSFESIAEKSLVLVLASEEYSEDDYIRNYIEFRKKFDELL